MRLLLSLLLIVWHFLQSHWLALALAAVVIVVYRVLVTLFGPGDFTGSGIVIGEPKNFDNRSLTMMLEQLDATLKSVNAVDPGVTKNLGAFQQQDATSTSKSLQFSPAPPPRQ